MTEASFISTAALVVIVAVVFGLLVVAVRRAGPEGGQQRWGIAALVLAGWIIVPAVLTRAHLLDRYVPMPAPALVMVGVINAATVVLALSPFGAQVAASVPLAALVGYQGFRLPLEMVLHRVYAEGAFLVPAALFGHVVVFRALARQRSDVLRPGA